MRPLPLIVLLSGGLAFLGLCVTGVALAGVGVVGGGGGGPPPAEESYILPRKLKLKPHALDPALSRLTVTGLLDTGPDAVDLGLAATLDVGGWSLDAAALAPNASGKLFTFEDEGLLLTVRPAPSGSSKASFRLKAQDDFDGLLVEDADTAVAFTSLACDGTSLVTLDGLSFTLGKKPGTLVAPELHLQAGKARLKGGGEDTLVLRLGLATGGVAPPAAPDVTLGFGATFSELVPSASFTRVGNKDVYAGPPGGLTSVVLDYAKERLVVKARDVDLGAFDEGGNAVTVWAQLDLDAWAVAVRMVRKGATLKY